MAFNEKELKSLAVYLIEEQSTMTLATASARGPWAAPIYYTFLGSAFYFFSDPSSRHIVDSLESGRASAAIFAQASSWQDIRGLQMSGVVQAVSVGATALRAVRSYLRKFPFTTEFFKPGDTIDLNAFADRFRVRLYRFKPDLVYYLDNSIKFGFREKVHL
ncbi:MAG TPA: pyridoxamine 5'-phosphate oxidase family protein [Syntrophobacteraceae bacterium]|nr:pyridoxamine 5'-phosphate oxidase family protein [Syntrophobacteraceae bacterium]